MRRHVWGMGTLFCGIMALSLAVLPLLTMGQPFFLPLQKKPIVKRERSVTVNVKGVELGWKSKPPQEATEAAPAPEETAGSSLRPYLLGASAFAIAGFALGTIALLREKRMILPGVAMGLCCLALFWQYVVVGVAAGAGVAVLLLLLGALDFG